MTTEFTPPIKNDTKALIIREAMKLFFEHGVHWVSFQQVADKVKISQPAIYRHFKDKDDLVVACTLKAAESGRQLIDEMVAEQKLPLKKLFAYIHGNLIWVDQKRDESAMLLAMYYFSHINPPLNEILHLIHAQSVARIKFQLDEGNKAKSWKIEKTEVFARAIHDLLTGEMIKTFYSPQEMNTEVRMKFLKNLLLSMIKVFGLVPPSR